MKLLRCNEIETKLLNPPCRRVIARLRTVTARIEGDFRTQRGGFNLTPVGENLTRHTSALRRASLRG